MKTACYSDKYTMAYPNNSHKHHKSEYFTIIKDSILFKLINQKIIDQSKDNQSKDQSKDNTVEHGEMTFHIVKFLEQNKLII